MAVDNRQHGGGVHARGRGEQVHEGAEVGQGLLRLERLIQAVPVAEGLAVEVVDGVLEPVPQLLLQGRRGRSGAAHLELQLHALIGVLGNQALDERNLHEDLVELRLKSRVNSHNIGRGLSLVAAARAGQVLAQRLRVVVERVQEGRRRSGGANDVAQGQPVSAEFVLDGVRQRLLQHVERRDVEAGGRGAQVVLRDGHTSGAVVGRWVGRLRREELVVEVAEELLAPARRDVPQDVVGDLQVHEAPPQARAKAATENPRALLRALNMLTAGNSNS
eukprot:CAMPEP_0204547510 /NCGR_PEP_ID=MMETSP0661-20131031/22849_1 /ASSEMBLY_ACC=CAM_ASM_000606 /TAXON_ID=109239 /ORGANISM="Alexandrium margalefi, Strain AMGDE01CS-322" /LENGTH=275 /DNA_ID=CAMNT_0051554377 /DNA_START=89 /DNA_END=916 /DNA_ORIENTATION=+